MKPNLTTIGDRLRDARQRVGLSQPELARLLGKSKQLVSAWEQGRSEILTSTLISAAQILDTDINFLLLGVDSTGKGGLRVSPKGNLVPLMRAEEVISLAQGDLRLENVSNKVYTYFPTGPKAFGFEMPDTSMNGCISRGELVIIDPDKVIEPGNIVAAVVYGDHGNELDLPLLVLREIRFLSTQTGKAPFDLAPFGRSYSTINIQKTDHATILGTLCASVRSTFPKIPTLP